MGSENFPASDSGIPFLYVIFSSFFFFSFLLARASKVRKMNEKTWGRSKTKMKPLRRRRNFVFGLFRECLDQLIVVVDVADL